MAWDTNISDVPWLRPTESPLDALTKGVQAGAVIGHNLLARSQMEQQAREFDATMGLRVQQQDLQGKEALVNIASQQLGNQAKELQLQDDLTWKDSMVKLASGEDVNPSFNIGANATRWQDFTSKTDLGESVADSRALHNKSVAATIQALNPLIPFSGGKPLYSLSQDDDGLTVLTQDSEAINAASKAKTQAAIDAKARLNGGVGTTEFIKDENGNPIYLKVVNPTGSITVHPYPGGGNKLDPSTQAKLTSLYRRLDFSQREMSKLKADTTGMSEDIKNTKLGALAREANAFQASIDQLSQGLKTNPQPQAPSRNQAITAPKVGDIVNGYKYKGGDPTSQESWTKP